MTSIFCVCTYAHPTSCIRMQCHIFRRAASCFICGRLHNAVWCAHSGFSINCYFVVVVVVVLDRTALTYNRKEITRPFLLSFVRTYFHLVTGGSSGGDNDSAWWFYHFFSPFVLHAHDKSVVDIAVCQGSSLNVFGLFFRLLALQCWCCRYCDCT